MIDLLNFIFFQVAAEVFNAMRVKLIGDDEALLKDFEAFRSKLHGRFKYAKLFKDEAELKREQEEKLERKQQKQLQQSQESSNGGGAAWEVAAMVDDLTIGEGGNGGGGGAGGQK